MLYSPARDTPNTLDSPKMKFRPFLPKLNIKRAATAENDVDSKSTGSITPTLAYYCPPPEVDIPARTRKEQPPRPPTPTSRLTFLAIWDPDSQRYTLPHVPPEDQVPDNDGRFQFDSRLGQGHPDCEPHLSSRFSTSTTSTSNFITVSHSQTTLPFPNPRSSSLRQYTATPPPPPSFPLPRNKPRERIGSSAASTAHSTISIASLLSRRPTLHSRPGTPSSVKTRPSTPKSRPSTPARPRTSSGAHSPLSFIKRRVSSAKEAEDAWVSLDVECVIRERIIRI
ncbi:uncharacterized protein EV420DRAFT_1639103 [Desarmillaria tabescens]|uniref:Uncharacterized protein n=1 Tax=Armillaria tabescens TaxID=1929756 RepID=A0AA39T406_ARMTA|nr:uncharacterized protein EV420DRAFT_1639103 [Desarmillaria tabescens]KAK0463016.1 hypothetical protein EV420DRAFT_1639103 [Desarmillaria tabescens]